MPVCDYDIWFNEVYHKYAKRLFSAAYQTMGSRETAEDLVHATYETLLSKGPEMMRHPNISRWLGKVLYNHMGNEMQRASNRREELYDPQEQEFPRSDTYFDFDEELPAGLKPEDRLILRLLIYEEQSYEYIAAYFGKTVEACRTQVHRAKVRCRKLMEEQKNFGESCHISPLSTNIKDRRCKDAKRT